MKRFFPTSKVRMLAAGGESTPFGDLQPDKFTAYGVAHFCHALPNFSQPDSASGYHSGFHPETLAKSHGRLLHKHINFNHKMKAYQTSATDNFAGAIVGVAYPETPEGGWQIGDSESDAPYITVLMALFKLAQGMPKLLGEMGAARQQWSVSVETETTRGESGIFVPSEKRVAALNEIDGAVLLDPKSGKMVMGQVEGKPSVFCFGGDGNPVLFPGLALTTNPAELTAGIETMRAESMDRDDLVVSRASAAASMFLPGIPVKWKKILMGDSGGGIVKQVYFSGEHEKHRCRLTATEENPVLEIALNGKPVHVLRHADSVYRTAK